MKRILIVNLGGFGDALLSFPALKGLRSLYPQAEISMLIARRIESIMKGYNFIDKVYGFDIGYGGIMPVRKIFNNIKVLCSLRNQHFDLAINMRTLVVDSGVRKFKFMLNFINPKQSAGRDTEGMGDFFDIKVAETLIGNKHELEYNIDLIKALGGDVVDKNIAIPIDLNDKNTVDQMLKANGLVEDDFLIGVHPGGRVSRRWPIDNFAKTIDQVSKVKKCKFIITAAKDELDLVAKLKSKIKTRVIDLTGEVSLRQLPALIKKCNLFVSNDTGPMHIAAILGVPLVAIFGPGDIGHYDPRALSDKAIVFYKRQNCAPCPKVECESLKCLKDISVEEVVSAILKEIP